MKIAQWGNDPGDNPAAPKRGIEPTAHNRLIRDTMAAVARWYRDCNGSLASVSEQPNVYRLTTNCEHRELADLSLTAFRVDRANTGAALLAVDKLRPKPMRLNGAALAAGDLQPDAVVIAIYNDLVDAFDLFGPLEQVVSSGKFDGVLTDRHEAEALGIFEWDKVGSQVTLWTEGSHFLVSDREDLMLTGLPAEITPDMPRRVFTELAGYAGLAFVQPGGTIRFRRSNLPLEPCPCPKGLAAGWTITYSV